MEVGDSTSDHEMDQQISNDTSEGENVNQNPTDAIDSTPREDEGTNMNVSGNSDANEGAADEETAPTQNVAESEDNQGAAPDSGEKDDAEIAESKTQDHGEDDGATSQYKTRRSIRRVSTEEAVSRKRTGSSVSGDEAPKKKSVRSNSVSLKQEGGQPKPQQGIVDESHDKYCWVCHKEGVAYHCKICPRSFHPKCISMADASEGDSVAKVCVCPECTLVMKAENIETRSEAMKLVSQDALADLLQYICDRLKSVPGADAFLNPVKNEDAEDYYDFIVYPMDIYTLEKNLKQGQYGSTEAFMADAQWIVHNSIVFNSVSSVYTHAAKRLLKVCKQELTEIETCPECYRNAHEKPTSWFVEACSRPHILVWAKLKGFPFWPAKAMKIKDDQVDVRFFGEHDRAWVKLADCLLYMIELPFTGKKPQMLNAALEELGQHVEKLKEKFGEVTFVTEKTQIGPDLSTEQLKRLFPDYKPENWSVKEQERRPSTLESKYKSRPSTKEKEGDTSASDSEANTSAKHDESAEAEETGAPDGEILANALGLTRINKAGQEPPLKRKSARLSTSEASVVVKEEPSDPAEADDGKHGTKTRNLMEQISNQTQAKPGYRFNISKDISISAIDDNEGDSDAEVKKPIRLPQGAGTGQLKGAGNQRYVMGKDGQLRPLIKPGTGGNMRPPMRTPIQAAMQPSMRKTRDGSYQPLSGEGNVKTATHQSQGAITLPGGSITVTPLAGSGRLATGANGLPMNGGGKFGKALRAQQQITRNFGPSVSSALPPSVRILVQNCLKACEDRISNTFVTAFADTPPAPKGESAGGEREQLQRLQQRIQKYEKELAELKQNHSLHVKEVKAGCEKRISDIKRMCEQDKSKQAVELKKKQWCAKCGHEAMFYCCWNTSYCGYDCQETHWPMHMTNCSQGQVRQGQGQGPAPENQQQLQNGAR